MRLTNDVKIKVKKFIMYEALKNINMTCGGPLYEISIPNTWIYKSNQVTYKNSKVSLQSNKK